MARQLADVGFTGVMATPHFIEGGFTFEPQLLRAKVDELNRACRKERIPLTFYPGGEIMAAYNFMADSRVFLPTLNSSRYLLLEIPPIIYSGEPSPCFSCVSIAFQSQALPLFFEEMLFNLNVRGCRLVLAHPERCYAFLQDPDKLLMLRKYEIIYQVNLVLGLMVALGLSFLLEFMDRTIKIPKDVTNSLQLPTLGAVPNFSKNLKKSK